MAGKRNQRIIGINDCLQGSRRVESPWDEKLVKRFVLRFAESRTEYSWHLRMSTGEGA